MEWRQTRASLSQRGRHVGEQGQHERLGVPERVPVVARPGQALRADGPLLGPGAGLQRLEEGEAQRLLQFGIAVDLDVGTRPEVVEVGTLRPRQSAEALRPRGLEAAVDLVAKPFHRLLRRPVIGEELDEAQRLSGRHCDRQRQPAEVGLAFDQRGGRVVGLDVVLHAGRERQPAFAGRMRQHHARAVGDVQAPLQGVRKSGRATRIRRRDEVALVGQQVRLQSDSQGPVERLDLVADRGDAAKAK